MAELVWDKTGERTFEKGIDRGVIYLPSGVAVPWNGLVSVSENNEKDLESVNFDGVKIHDIVSYGSFSATLSAFTYPSAIELMVGTEQITRGIYVDEQPTKRFGLSYRTNRGDDLNPEAGYKIHVIYNVSAILAGREYTTTSDDPALNEFQWELSAVPEYLDNYRPSSHLILDSTKIDPFLLIEIEKILYGNSEANASLISMNELVQYLNEWFRVKIIDHGDGTWSATSEYEGYIFPNYPSVDYGLHFMLQNVDAVFLDDAQTHYEITDSSIQIQDPALSLYSDEYGLSY